MRSLFGYFFRWVTLPQGCFLFVLFIYFLLEEGHIRNTNTETDPSNLLLARKPLTMSFRPKLFCFRPRKTLKFLMETSPVNSCFFFSQRALVTSLKCLFCFVCRYLCRSWYVAPVKSYETLLQYSRCKSPGHNFICYITKI